MGKRLQSCRTARSSGCLLMSHQNLTHCQRRTRLPKEKSRPQLRTDRSWPKRRGAARLHTRPRLQSSLARAFISSSTQRGCTTMCPEVSPLSLSVLQCVRRSRPSSQCVRRSRPSSQCVRRSRPSRNVSGGLAPLGALTRTSGRMREMLNPLSFITIAEHARLERWDL